MNYEEQKQITSVVKTCDSSSSERKKNIYFSVLTVQTRQPLHRADSSACTLRSSITRALTKKSSAYLTSSFDIGFGLKNFFLKLLGSEPMISSTHVQCSLANYITCSTYISDLKKPRYGTMPGCCNSLFLVRVACRLLISLLL